MAHEDSNRGDRRYVGQGVPHSVGEGRVHEPDTQVGERGLRAWTQPGPPREVRRGNPNLGRGFPGKNAYVIWERGRESRLSRQLRRVARERAIQHRRQWHRAWARVRELLAHRNAED
jgi:hypothetical protein